MKPIKPKYRDSVKVEWKISKRSELIINNYAKYTKYEESEIIDNLILDILEDKEFIEWLNKKRYRKKINDVIFGESETTDNPKSTYDEGDVHLEEIEEDSPF